MGLYDPLIPPVDHWYLHKQVSLNKNLEKRKNILKQRERKRRNREKKEKHLLALHIKSRKILTNEGRHQGEK